MLMPATYGHSPN